jgi:hypothetical protein
MDTVLVATPLRSAMQAQSLPSDLAIREIRPILWDFAAKPAPFSEEERNLLSTTHYWLSASKTVENWALDANDQSLYEKVHRAMYAWQILCPTNAVHVYMKFRETPEGFDPIGYVHFPKLTVPFVARIVNRDEHQIKTDFPAILDGVNRAFDSSSVRLQNPILLLEHGLQTDNVYLSMLMWVMGLDVLLMAGNIGPFVDRLEGFLGGTAYVFPPVNSPQRQPRPTVADVANHVYELRNKIAHGIEVPKNPFRLPHTLEDTSGQRINWEANVYVMTLQNAALFLLIRCLRKIFLSHLADDVENEQSWKTKLNVFGGLARSRRKSTTG